jgi:hypothetical protein
LPHLIPYHWSQPGTIDSLVQTTITAAPGILFLRAYGVHLLGAVVPDPRWRRLLAAAFVLAALSPHALNVIGWDTGRWNSISLWAALLCVACMHLVLLPAAPSNRRRALTPWLWAAGLVALVLGLCVNTELFDGYVVQWFLFDGQWRSALELWRGHFHFIPRY